MVCDLRSIIYQSWYFDGYNENSLAEEKAIGIVVFVGQALSLNPSIIVNDANFESCRLYLNN